MATTTKKSNKKTTVATIKDKAANINQMALKTTNDIVEETIATGEQWQNLLAKTLRKGTTMFGKQQDLVFSGLEMLKDQYSYGSKRLRKLLASEPTKSKTPKTATNKTAATAKTSKNIDEVMDAAKATEKKVKTTAKKVVKSVQGKKATTAKTPEKPAVATEKATAAKAVPATKLTLIEGIGPKIEELLNKSGITNFTQLAEASPADLKQILTDAGNRFQMHDPSTWAAQAKLAAAGKMEELEVLQAELKGGK